MLDEEDEAMVDVWLVDLDDSADGCGGVGWTP
jgi:hypothetical protein